jgi:hypothetical protein
MIYAGLDQGNRLDWLNSGVVSGLFAGGGLLVVAFIAAELTVEYPLMVASGGQPQCLGPGRADLDLWLRSNVGGLCAARLSDAGARSA